MKSRLYFVTGAGVVGLLLGFNLWYWLQAPLLSPTSTMAPALSTQAVDALTANAPALPVASRLPERHSIEVKATTPAAATTDIESALVDLFGRKSVLAMFLTDDLARRVVATVDNLGREHAAVRLWPVHPTAGRFTVVRRGDDAVIGADNELRYTPFVLLVETVDLQQVVAAYTQFHLQFQQAYEDLGFPNHSFDDRLVEVIDLLLATPEPASPLKVQSQAANGPTKPRRPWVMFEFDDPALQALTAGQRILLRMGPVNERRMKAKLAEIRHLLTATSQSR